MAAPHSHQRASDIAHHMVQKGIGANFNYHQSALAKNPHLFDATIGGAGLAAGSAEGGKIIFTQKPLGGAVHGVGVEGFAPPGHQATENAGGHRFVANHIAIGARQRGKAGVKIAGHPANPMQAHPFRQATVRPLEPVAGVAPGAGVEMDDLIGGVNAGIGAPCAGDGDGLVGHKREGIFYHRLHAGAVALALPTAEGSPAVFNGGGYAFNPLRQRLTLWKQTVGGVTPDLIIQAGI